MIHIGLLNKWNDLKIVRKLRFFFVYPILIWAFMASHTTENQLRAGILLVFIGEWIRLWANGYVGHRKVSVAGEGEQKIGHLITGGPYAYVRNPLYVGSILIGVGVCVTLGNLWAAFFGFIAFVWIYNCKIQEEEARIQNEWGEEYARYCASVPRWIPSWRPYEAAYGEWSWQGIVASKEWRTLIWTAVILLGFYLREELIQEHEWMAAGKWPKQLFAIAGIIMLVLCDLFYGKKKVSVPA
jgi:protein-S-isoprenylcysteine O-methyltransferase Ste14